MTTLKDVMEVMVEVRDLARSTDQTIQQVVKPALKKVENHERSLQRVKGALWAFSIVFSTFMLIVSVIAST